jgi:hypothetical protein
MNLQTLIAPVGRSTVAIIAPLDAEGMTSMTGNVTTAGTSSR